MGTTIRREPVNFAIPAAPDYKFLNITNFRGLDISSNPFELSPNTASDCLNVYVDETNTLTTRPRLEKKIATPIEGEPVGTYNLHNGYLLHYLVNGVGVMQTLIDNTLTEIEGNIPTVMCKHFEHGDNIYLLDGSRYMVVSDNVLKDVEGYIPVINILDATNTSHSVESLNLLSDSYLEKYYWDGVNNPYGSNSVDKTSTKNNAIRKIIISTDLSEYEYLQFFEDDTYLFRNKTTKELFVGAFTNNYSEILLTATGIYPRYPYNISMEVKAASVGKTICIREEYPILSHNRYVYDYVGNNQWKFNNSIYIRDDVDTYDFGVSPNGKYYWELADSTAEGSVFYIKVTATAADAPSESNISIGLDNITKPIKPLFLNDSDNYDHYLLCENTTTPNEKTIIKNFTTGTRIEVARFQAPENVKDGYLTKNNNIFYTYYTEDNKDYLLLVNLSTGSKTQYVYPEKFISNYFRFLSDSQTMFWFDSKNYLWVADVNNPYAHYNTYFKVDSNVIYTKDFNIIITESSEENEPFNFYFWNDSDPTISVVSRIGVNTDIYIDWKERREKLLKSHIVTRFDNNYWFAYGNAYCRSANNDPTYFPITEYNELGDSNEEITGFNLANDTTLIAYKPNNLYLIQPFTSSLDTVEYTITESKNTVGNTAFSAPIVTTLTEIPLQINNDGIYGLTQLTNVSSPERVADLMSEPINERWLNIDDDLITHAQTLNRLYWTYIIIPDAENDKTMIYLLDNRTNSWYYWEIPIVVLNSFVKDNITEFVDIDGNIYYLTSTDIQNKSFDTQLVTEYYDDGRKLIPWYWQSQIMPLGTMNYSKRLVNTTFILTDTDTQDGYGLTYKFKVFRKLASSTPEKEISGELNLVRSMTKKTNISKFGFVQLKLSNITEESQGTEPEKAFRNNKLRLVGLGLKYVLLEGLMR